MNLTLLTVVPVLTDSPIPGSEPEQSDGEARESTKNMPTAAIGTCEEGLCQPETGGDSRGGGQSIL